MSGKNKQKVPQKINGGKFEVAKKIGAGCFGEVYRAVNTETKEDVAIKFEESHAPSPQLEHEATTLNILRQPVQPQGFPEYYYFGKEANYNVLVMEFLGKSLEDRVQNCKGKFTVKTTVLVAEQILNRIEYLHSKGIVHRDIKPENFMWGIKDKIHHLYLIDYGLSKKYYDKQHVQMRQKLSLTGTARYASINAHRGIEQSRRDDLEAIGHMLLYFLRAQLPWSGLEAKSKQEKYRKIKEKKEEIPIQELCAGFPDAFEIYLNYCRNLGFKERPDYNFLRKLFTDVRDGPLFEKEAPVESHHLEWLQELDSSNLVPLTKVDTQQPEDCQSGGGGGGFCFCGSKSKVKD
eukprot:CAMPEP_0169166988 /NCGR_PEP_ID=MMETSP1015-20121227/60231_1 /TAXON_ID=342587 /ORGANISM="Karlodinium micrum, Strain CCMP2283" /LENGTH=347 /DNA_ID=CAMNT_0009239667 /DNA_START=93 /DNA_END=1136 /DNA_ORIENTATION=-